MPLGLIRLDVKFSHLLFECFAFSCGLNIKLGCVLLAIMSCGFCWVVCCCSGVSWDLRVWIEFCWWLFGVGFVGFCFNVLVLINLVCCCLGL